MGREQKIRNGLLVTAIMLVGICVGVIVTISVQKDNTEQLQQRYDMLSKRILIDNPNDVLLDFRSLKADLQRYVDTKIGTDNVSLYFEYLPTGSSVGINEDKEVVGASLLKLPVAITVYKLAEQGKVNLDQKLSLKKEWLNDEYGTLYKEGEGFELTVREAAQYALEQSDNTAVLALVDVMQNAEGSNALGVLEFVDTNYDTTPDQRVLIGAQSYSSILKCLYFSCYLNKDDSQELLEYLSLSTADDRVAKYIPDDTKVAHKIGSYGDETQSDCGIFYLDKRNYLLCVMMQGKDPAASEHIAALSKIVYDSVSAQ